MKRRLLHKIAVSGDGYFDIYVGGVSSQITTAAQLETRLFGTPNGEVLDFEIYNTTDVRCNLANSGYDMVTRAFGNVAGAFPYNILTHFVDYRGKFRQIFAQQQFFGQSNLDFVFIPNLTLNGLVGFQHFRLSGIKTCYLYGDSGFNKLGDTSGDNGVFAQTVGTLDIYIRDYFATNNAGSPDGDLTLAVVDSVTYLSDATIPTAVQTKLDAILSI